MLVTDGTKLRDVDGSSEFDLAVAPLDKSLPYKIIGCLTDDASNRVGVATEVSINGLIAETFNIKVAIATCGVLHFPKNI